MTGAPNSKQKQLASPRGFEREYGFNDAFVIAPRDLLEQAADLLGDHTVADGLRLCLLPLEAWHCELEPAVPYGEVQR